MEWQSRTGKRSRGRPAGRWRDDIVKSEGTTWMKEGNRQKLEVIIGGLHPAVGEQRPERKKKKIYYAICNAICFLIHCAIMFQQE